MPKFNPRNNGSNNHGGGDDHPATTTRIVEKRCSICQHSQRNNIDRLLALSVNYSDIGRLFGVDRRAASNHAKEHLGYEETAIRQIIEQEALASEENLELGVSLALRRRAALDIAINKVLDGLASGEILVEAKDLPKFVELREKLDKEHSGAAVETVIVQFNAFKQAVLELAPPDLKWNILERTKEILDAQEVTPRAALQPGQDGTVQAPE